MNKRTSRQSRERYYQALGVGLSIALIVGCAQIPPLTKTDRGLRIPVLEKPPVASAVDANRMQAPAGAGVSTPSLSTGTMSLPEPPGDTGTRNAEPYRFWQTPPAAPSSRDALTSGRLDIPPPVASDEKLDASVNLENIPLPAFASTIFATILKKNVSLDSSLQKRTDLVSLRTGQPVTARQLAASAAAVLRSYGVVTLEHDGLVRLVPDNAPASGAIELLRSRSQPDVPARIRPVFHFYELQQANAPHAAQWVRNLFQARVTVQEDQQRNALLLSGQSDAVASAIEALEILDQPYLRGRHSARISPVFWSAQDLATRLGELLTAQGIYVGNSPNITAPLLLIPVPQINSIVVFGTSPEMVDHALRWARDLDRAPQARRNGRYVTYHVRNTDAKSLATTLAQLMGGVAATAPSAPGAVAPAPTTAAALPGGARVVVNTAANSLILQTNPEEYTQLRELLVELDRPPRSALIMVTVAEVSLTDSEQFGFNWLLKQFSLAGYRVNGNIGGSGTAAGSGGGLNLGFANVAGDPRAVLSALATNNRVRVLSNPSIVAMNGEQASIQVGQDVPVLSSQISSTGSGNSTGGQNLLQSVQYRNIGIILNITPVIHSAGRVELKLSQEVSGVSSGAVGVGNSPVFTTRRVDTKLSAMDGQSTLIGGLIREQRDGGNTGVPVAKDVPVLGGLFRSGSNETVARTELVILLTPYIMEDDVDAQALTEAFRNQFTWVRDDRDKVTLPTRAETPPALPNPQAAIQQSVPAVTATVPSAGGPSGSESPSDPQAPQPYLLKPQLAVPPITRNAPPGRAPEPERQGGAATEQVRPAQRPAGALTEGGTSPRTTQPTSPTTGDHAPAPPGRPVVDPDLLRQLRNAVDQSRSTPAKR